MLCFSLLPSRPASTEWKHFRQFQFLSHVKNQGLGDSSSLSSTLILNPSASNVSLICIVPLDSWCHWNNTRFWCSFSSFGFLSCTQSILYHNSWTSYVQSCLTHGPQVIESGNVDIAQPMKRPQAKLLRMAPRFLPASSAHVELTQCWTVLSSPTDS